MSNCITCGSKFDNSFNAIVKRKKHKHDTDGTEYYVYKQNKSNVWQITRKEYFKVIYEKEKPSEYFHISEFKPS